MLSQTISLYEGRKKIFKHVRTYKDLPPVNAFFRNFLELKTHQKQGRKLRRHGIQKADKRVPGGLENN